MALDLSNDNKNKKKFVNKNKQFNFMNVDKQFLKITNLSQIICSLYSLFILIFLTQKKHLQHKMSLKKMIFKSSVEQLYIYSLLKRRRPQSISQWLFYLKGMSTAQNVKGQKILYGTYLPLLTFFMVEGQKAFYNG